jgi:hypothetical protein
MPTAGPRSSGGFRALTAESPEHGLFRIKPSGWGVLHEGWPTWLAVAAVVAASFLEALWTDMLLPEARLAVFRFGLAVILFRVVYDVLGVLTTEFVLTDRRATTTQGFFHPRETVLMLEEIEQVELRRSLLQRLTGTGTLLFHVEGVEPALMAWMYVKSPGEVREIVVAAVERARRFRRPAA